MNLVIQTYVFQELKLIRFGAHIKKFPQATNDDRRATDYVRPIAATLLPSTNNIRANIK